MLLLERHSQIADIDTKEELDELKQQLDVERKIRERLQYELDLSRKTTETQVQEQIENLRREIEAKYDQWRLAAEEELKASLRKELQSERSEDSTPMVEVLRLETKIQQLKDCQQYMESANETLETK